MSANTTEVTCVDGPPTQLVSWPAPGAAAPSVSVAPSARVVLHELAFYAEQGSSALTSLQDLTRQDLADKATAACDQNLHGDSLLGFTGRCGRVTVLRRNAGVLAVHGGHWRAD